MCIVGRSAINSKRHVHPLPSQSHSSTGARTDTRPFLDSWHDDVDTRPFFLTLVWECVSVVVHSFFFCILFISYLSHAALSLAVSRCTLSPCLSTQAARQQAWRARLAERGHGAWAALAAVRGGSAPACGAVVWREARRLDGRCSSFFLLHGDPAGRSATRRRQAGGCSRRSEAAPGSLTCMRSGAAASAQQRLGRALQSRGGGGGPWPTAGRRRCEEKTFQICLVSVYATA